MIRRSSRAETTTPASCPSRDSLSASERRIRVRLVGPDRWRHAVLLQPADTTRSFALSCLQPGLERGTTSPNSRNKRSCDRMSLYQTLYQYYSIPHRCICLDREERGRQRDGRTVGTERAGLAVAFRECLGQPPPSNQHTTTPPIPTQCFQQLLLLPPGFLLVRFSIERFLSI